jgi:hypothetical protein
LSTFVTDLSSTVVTGSSVLGSTFSALVTADISSFFTVVGFFSGVFFTGIGFGKGKDFLASFSSCSNLISL